MKKYDSFNWDYKNTQDNSGLEASLNWQSTPHINWEAWVGNQLAGGRTVANTALPGTDETFFGLRFKWTGQPVIFREQNIKQNLDIRPVRWIDEVFEIALEKMPEPNIKKESKSDVTGDKSEEKNDSIRPH